MQEEQSSNAGLMLGRDALKEYDYHIGTNLYYTSAAILFIATFPHAIANLILQESGHQLAQLAQQAQLQFAKTFNVKSHCYKVAF